MSSLTLSVTINPRVIAKFLLVFVTIVLFSSWGKVPDHDTLHYRAGETAFKLAISNHSFNVQGKQCAYQTTAGYQPLADSTGKTLANIFYTSYTVPAINNKKRPVTFLFNGGPGSASLWLHMGAFGPVRVNEKGVAGVNEDTWLAYTDLVFIDPIGTGYSRTADGIKAEQFYGYKEDIASIESFIKQYIAEHHLENNPKFLAGESYGALRAIGLADELDQKDHIKLAGITLISPAINYQLISFKSGNETAYSYYLPSYAIAAQYHKLLSAQLEKLSQKELMDKATNFAQGSYLRFLNLGDAAPVALKHQIIDSLSYYTGLSKQHLKRINGRITDDEFANGLLNDGKNITGTFDSRLRGKLKDGDPSVAAIRDPYTKAFQQYLSHDLGYRNNLPYLATTATSGWNYGPEANNSYMDATATLRKILIRSPALRINVAGGYYDLATPVSTTAYVFNHLGVNTELRSHIMVKYYQAGHMIYTGDAANNHFSHDSRAFYSNTLNTTKA